MREIKFRAWSDSGKKFYYSNDEAYLLKEYDGVLWLIEDIGFYSPEKEAKEYLKIGLAIEYTGLKDKKRTEEYPEGQDIYDEDIVRMDLGSMGMVVGFIKYSTVESDECFGGFFFYELDEDCNGFSLGKLMVEKSEVIGNVRENPEFIEVSNENSKTG